MTFPFLNINELQDFLKDNGCELISSEYWSDFNRVIFKKGDSTFPIQLSEKNYYPKVCKICEQLEINPPEDHKICWDQHKELNKKKRGSD